MSNTSHGRMRGKSYLRPASTTNLVAPLIDRQTVCLFRASALLAAFNWRHGANNRSAKAAITS